MMHISSCTAISTTKSVWSTVAENISHPSDRAHASGCTIQSSCVSMSMNSEGEEWRCCRGLEESIENNVIVIAGLNQWMDNGHMDTALLHSRPISNSTTICIKEGHLFMANNQWMVNVGTTYRWCGLKSERLFIKLVHSYRGKHVHAYIHTNDRQGEAGSLFCHLAWCCFCFPLRSLRFWLLTCMCPSVIPISLLWG